jgi:formylmethanofuran dehydrogenase subunit C
MTPLVLTLREAPPQRLDLSGLVPHKLAKMTASDISRIAIATTREPVAVGDLFAIRMGDPLAIRFEGGSERFDEVGHGLAEGEIVVNGDVGLRAGRLMTGGRLVIAGHAGPWAASGLKSGTIEIGGSAAERLGGPLPGEVAGMRGGLVIVRGDAGERAGDRLRRGTILIEGRAGRNAASRMIAGTLMVGRSVGPLPGYLMRRGTLVVGAMPETPSPTFVDCGVHDLVAQRLLAAYVQPYSGVFDGLLKGSLRRFAGDMAAMGKGELFCPPA